MPLEMDDITNKDMALVAAFQKYTTRVHATESFSFWFDKGNNEGRYAKYIKPGAPKELNLANSNLVKTFAELAAASDYAGMDDAFTRARAEVEGMLAGRLGNFEISAEYKAYLAVKKSGNVAKALKLLGVPSKHAKTMETLLKEYALATTAPAKKTILEKMQKIAKSERLEAVLKSSGLQ